MENQKYTSLEIKKLASKGRDVFDILISDWLLELAVKSDDQSYVRILDFRRNLF